jgi:hypothetical protein
MSERRVTHKEMVRSYLLDGYSITPMDALNMFGCMRLAAVVHDLRKDGYNIKTIEVSKKNPHGRTIKYARYLLVRDEQKAS